jgi:DNA ligase-1
MQLHDFVTVSNTVAAARGRLDKIGKLSELLTRLHPDEIRIAVAYLSGSLPQGRIGVGWSVISQARAITPASQPSLALRDIHELFGRISGISGAGAAKARAQLLIEVFSRATEGEQDFLVRLLSGELRQGAQEGVLAEAIAKAAGVSGDSVRQAAMMCGDLADVACAALAEGASALSKYQIQLFRPVEPMLASPAESVTDAITAFGEAAFELKLDGARIQVHKGGNDVRVFSRALRDVTAAVPEIVEAVAGLGSREIILDGEVLALQADGTPLPFQETMRRFGRRLDIDRLRAELPLTPFFFDCLYIDGGPVTREPQRQRFAAVQNAAPQFAVPHRIINDAVGAAEFFERAIGSGHEGVMAKSLDAPYAAGSRGSAWLKIKNVRTLDLIVIAAEWGSGRRRGWLSNLHLAARDPERDRLVMLGKTFKGMTDALLEWQTAALLERETSRDGNIVHVRPELVVEVAFNDLQTSPQYPGGLALRFARVKGYRPDKRAEDADTLQTLQNIYRSMTGRDAPAPRP